MFERRLKLFLLILAMATGLLLLRATQVQVLSHEHWRQRASQTMKRFQLLETTRGRILDVKEREIAGDVACIDACVDYRAIQERPDEKWVEGIARGRLLARQGARYRQADRPQRVQMLVEESRAVLADIDRMWATLARLSHQSIEDLEQVRRGIIQKVEMRRRYLWYWRYRDAVDKHAAREPSPWYKQWLLDEIHETPRLDSFGDDVAEQTEAHAILRAIPTEVSNELGKNIDRYPGLVLRPSTHRSYPYGDAACHVLGHLSRVTREDLQNDPNVGTDDLRRYYPNDLIGRSGLEALFEPQLRGARGRTERLAGDERVVASTPASPGQDVRTTLDIELQADIQQMFAQARTINGDGTTSEPHAMYGAAVVIDIPTNEVRALVSYPSFDPNKLDEQFSQLLRDEINKPLLNRATQAQLEPGSTIKPVVGLGAITQGVARVHEGIECTGFLVLGGRRYSIGRCWVASQYAERFGVEGVKHHPFPLAHRGTHGNPDGFLTFADSLERSCNVYFETVGDRLGIDGLAHWFRHMGLGRRTGLGIAEAAGRIPDPDEIQGRSRRHATWMAGIGQGPVAATPIQMANIAATIARDGIWMRPRLAQPGTLLDESRLRDEEGVRIPDRLDLHLDAEALREARRGMIRVVNSQSGTGTYLKRDDVVIAGKTGTAQAARFSIIKRDEAGRIVRDERGRALREFLRPSTSRDPNPAAPWYRGTGEDESKLDHAWMIGFAPADKPQIAFAVMVEYGGSGGRAAAPIASQILEKCVEHGYLAVGSSRLSAGAAQHE